MPQLLSRRLLAAAFVIAAAMPAAAQQRAEVIHWWTSGGESAAVKVFADQFDKAVLCKVDDVNGGRGVREKQLERGAADASGAAGHQDTPAGDGRPELGIVRFDVLGEKRGRPTGRQAAQPGIKEQGPSVH